MGRERGSTRQQQLDTAIATIQRRFGSWALIRGNARAAGSTAIPHISSGFPALDRALGTEGLPKGGICELVGPATSGKTTMALKFLVQAQREGGQVGYVDQALYFDPDYAHRCGVDLSRLLVGTPGGRSEALAMVEALVRNGGLSAVIVDTLDILWDDAGADRTLVTMLSRLHAPLARSGMVLVLLHESPLGSSMALSALAHAATLRLQVVREHWLRQHGDIRGYQARVEVLKNRFGPAGRVVSLALEFNGTVHADGL